MTLLVFYLKAVFVFGNFSFGMFKGLGLEGAEGVIVEGECVGVGSSFGFGAFISDVGREIFGAFSVNLDLGCLEGFDENGGDSGGENFLCEKLFRRVSE